MKYVIDGKPVCDVTYKTADQVARAFFEDLMRELYDSLDRVAGETFYMHLSEWKNGEKSPTYLIRIAGLQDLNEIEEQLESKPDEGLQLFETEVIQYYSAVNTDDPEQNYSGHINISLTMFADRDDEDKCYVPNWLAEKLTAIALFYYYDKTKAYYPEWQTLYHDCPEINTYEIRGVQLGENDNESEEVFS